MPTRKDIRRGVLGDGQIGGVFTASGGTTTTITTTDPRFADTAQDVDRPEGWAVLRPAAAAAGDRWRRVASVTAGTLTVSPAYTNAPTNGEEIEYVKLPLEDPLSDLNRVINQGLVRCWYEARYNIPLVTKQREYDLSAVPGLESPIDENIRGLSLRVGADVTEYRRRSYARGGYAFATFEDGPVRTLVIDPPIVDTTNKALFLVYQRPYEALTDDTSNLDIALDWAVAAALMRLYHTLVGGIEGSAYQPQLSHWTREWVKQTANRAPKPLLSLRPDMPAVVFRTVR